MNEVERRSGPVIEMYEVEESRERRIVIGYKWVINSAEYDRMG
jgi:glutamate dehydrogenase